MSIVLQTPFLNTLIPAVMGGLAICIGAYACYRGVALLRAGGGMAATDPVDAADVAEARGVVDVSGTARPLDGTVTARFSGVETLSYAAARQKLDVGTGPEDPNTWDNIDLEEDQVPFVVEDDTGRVAVDPAGATLSRDGEVIESGNNRRKKEWRLDPGESVHVYGQRRDTADVGADSSLSDESVYVGDGEEVTFRIADSDRGSATMSVLIKGGAAAIGGLIVMVFGGVLLLSPVFGF